MIRFEMKKTLFAQH